MSEYLRFVDTQIVLELAAAAAIAFWLVYEPLKDIARMRRAKREAEAKDARAIARFKPPDLSVSEAWRSEKLRLRDLD